MKKIFLFLMAGALSLSSCSSDDDGTSPGDDPIIGSWVLVDINPSSIIDPTACEQNSTITFNEGKTGTANFYNNLEDCEETNASGMWENVGDSQYSVEFPQPIGRQQGEVEFQDEDTFYFTLDFSGVLISLTFDRQE